MNHQELSEDVPRSSQTMCVKSRAIPPNGGAINARNGRSLTQKSCNSEPVYLLIDKLGRYIKENVLIKTVLSSLVKV